MKSKYVKPKLSITLFATEDIITTSSTTGIPETNTPESEIVDSTNDGNISAVNYNTLFR